MKKIKILIPITVIVLILSTTVVQGDYQVSIGETFTYNVNTSNWSIKLGGNSSSVSKCLIVLYSYDEGTSFTVEVTDVVPDTSVSWNLTVGSFVFAYQNDDTDLFQLGSLLLHIVGQAVVYATIWSQETVDLGPSVHYDFFFNTAHAILDHFRFYANSSYWSPIAADPRHTFTQIDGNFDESGAVAIFDWIVDGTLNYTSPYNFLLDGYERFKIAFDKTTGVMQGYRLELDYDGVIEGQNFEMKLNQEVTINGYTLPTFYYDKPAGLPGFEWYLSITAFSAILIVSVILKKKRK